MARYKKRNDGRYARQFKVGYQPDGRPKYKTIYAKTRAELDKKCAEFLSLKNRGVVLADANISLEVWAEQWLRSYKGNYSYNTYVMYERCVRNHICKAPFAGFPIRKITVADLQNLLNSKIQEGLTRSVEILRLTLKQIFKAAIENDLIYKNVADYISIPNLKAPPKRTLTDIELSAISKAPLTDKQRCFIYLGLYAGLRKGEILALGKQDIDFSSGVIRITRSLVMQDKDSFIKQSPKSDAGNREIPMPAILRDTLKEYISHLPGFQLFTKKDGDIMNRSAWNAFWRKLSRTLNEAVGDDYDLVTFTPHILRHTYATNILKAGIDLKTAQKLLGHSTIAMTMDIYNHITIDSKTLASRLDHAFQNQSKISQN